MHNDYFINWIWKYNVKKETHIFGLSLLHKSLPNKFAAINISRKLGINWFVIKNAHVDIAQFINNETLMKFSIFSPVNEYKSNKKFKYSPKSHQHFVFIIFTLTHAIVEWNCQPQNYATNKINDMVVNFITLLAVLQKIVYQCNSLIIRCFKASDN